ncbi:MAG TPA: DUF2378 family protein [Polyangiales bacterium]|nr:DUF2378 family protein [Polyangiales bacterium]
MLIAPMIAEAKRHGIDRAAARERYLAFNWYPLREHARLLIDHCRDFYPELSLRAALRKIGRAAPDAFLGSTVGKVTLAPAEGIHDIVAAFCKAYALTLDPGAAQVLEQEPRQIIVGLREVHHFLDCHHVGAFEGALKRAGVRGKVSIAQHGQANADLLLEW